MNDVEYNARRDTKDTHGNITETACRTLYGFRSCLSSTMSPKMEPRIYLPQSVASFYSIKFSFVALTNENIVHMWQLGLGRFWDNTNCKMGHISLFLVASLMSITSSPVTTTRVQQFCNVTADIYKVFLFLFSCCILLEKLTTTTQTTLTNDPSIPFLRADGSCHNGTVLCKYMYKYILESLNKCRKDCENGCAPYRVWFHSIWHNIVYVLENGSSVAIGIDTSISVIMVSPTTWEAHHSPRAKPEGCGELPRSLVTPQWLKSRYQFLFYHDASKHIKSVQIWVCISRKSLLKLLQLSHYGKHGHRPLSQQLP